MPENNEDLVKRITDLENEVQVLKSFNEYHSGKGVFIKTKAGREIIDHLTKNDLPFEIIYGDTFRMPSKAYQILQETSYDMKEVTLHEAYTRQPGKLREEFAKKYGRPELERGEASTFRPSPEQLKFKRGKEDGERGIAPSEAGSIYLKGYVEGRKKKE